MVNHKLYEKDTYKNSNISYLFNTEIIEYDMSEAGYSLIREYKLLPQDIIDKLSSMSKQNRHITIGKIERENKVLVENKKNAFIEARRMFMEENDVEEDDILFIKKDALFLLKKCKHQKFGKYINFRPKNYYTSYVALTRNLDILYVPSMDPVLSKIDVKGIGDSKVELHNEYFIGILKRYFYMMENSDVKSVLSFLVDMIDKYKSHSFAEIGYYRDFDQNSNYTLLDPDSVYDNDEELIENIDISVNLKHLIHLIKISL